MIMSNNYYNNTGHNGFTNTHFCSFFLGKYNFVGVGCINTLEKFKKYLYYDWGRFKLTYISVKVNSVFPGPLGAG